MLTLITISVLALTSISLTITSITLLKRIQLMRTHQETADELLNNANERISGTLDNWQLTLDALKRVTRRYVELSADNRALKALTNALITSNPQQYTPELNHAYVQALTENHAAAQAAVK